MKVWGAADLTKIDRVYLNGRFLTQPMTGVQRYATEMMRALDRLVVAGAVPAPVASARWTLLTREPVNLPLQAIGMVVAKKAFHSQAWEQMRLHAAAKNGVLLSLANSGPVLHRRHLVVIHDAIVFRHPEFYARRYVAFHRAMGRLLARTAAIGTVSAFSQRELSQVLGRPAASISIFPNGADHLAQVRPDDTVLDELDLRGRPFFLALGSLNGNKNVGLAIEAFSRLDRPEARLVVVGSPGSIFRAVEVGHSRSVVMAGRLPDERIASLYAHAAAFVFPSIYEGFGIPPLEAMAFGSPVIASAAEAVREVCGEAASYFPVNDASALAALLKQRLDEGPISDERREQQRRRAAEFTWDASAKRLLEALSQL